MRAEDSGHHRVSVWLDDAEDLARVLEAGAAANFNRRGAYRVAPAADSPVTLALNTADGSWSHTDKASDLSASGVGVLVDEATAKQMETAHELTLSLSLPGAHAPLHFVSHVRRVIAKDAGHLVGLDFDPVNTDNFDALAERVVDYIMRRQRELLREGRPD